MSNSILCSDKLLISLKHPLPFGLLARLHFTLIHIMCVCVCMRVSNPYLLRISFHFLFMQIHSFTSLMDICTGS